MTTDRPASSSSSPDGPIVDLLVVGGGVNGAGVARDAAGRGLSVVLCEKDDLASATSSASSKLVHGGLRYLEYYEFRLVRESLKERETLLRAAPHIIWPLRFVLPHHTGLRPAWMLRAGLFLYDHLGRREILPGSAALDLARAPAGAPLKESFRRGFEYSDCWVDDARLVVLNAQDATARGAEVLTRTAFVGADREGAVWRARLEGRDGARRTVRARAIVNAAGPWVQDALRRVEGARRSNAATLRLVKGSHVITRKLFDGEHAYIFQNADGRILFAIPYEGAYTLLGTTDVPYTEDPGAVRAEESEIDYLLEMASVYFRTPVSRADMVRTYSGVRPLYDDASDKSASAVTRDYVFDLDMVGGEAPLLSIYGGKITTYRKLAEHALAKLQPVLGVETGAWTAGPALPGGDMPDADFERFAAEAGRAHPWLPPAVLRRLARAYGTRLERVLGGAGSAAGLGRDFGGGFSEAELAYLMDEEWARTAEDVLWRRSKLGLHLPEAAQSAIAEAMERAGGGAPPADAVAGGAQR
ncbi:MAG: glycerol-3-phosphate dehydrogenase [Caulobacterales bacterium]|nr:glycerol-3-phosphate dehydrogenase [Caulobacterales bacterium]